MVVRREECQNNVGEKGETPTAFRVNKHDRKAKQLEGKSIAWSNYKRTVDLTTCMSCVLPTLLLCSIRFLCVTTELITGKVSLFVKYGYRKLDYQYVTV